jgi:SAM-dependent methyltransferase
MSIPGREHWQQTPLGRYVADWERARAELLVGDVFGFNAVQIGMTEVDFLKASRIALKVCVDEDAPARLRCDAQQLPFAAASIDLVVLPHVLEFHGNPHQILREVERVLIPEGRLLIAGFNPFSLWGLRRRLYASPPEYPFSGRYLGMARLKDWLSLLNMDIERGHFGCYAPPLARLNNPARFSWLEKAGHRWWPIAGGVYVIRAVKRVPGMRLMRPAWKGAAVRRKLAQVLPSQPSSHG